jgi:hypothetical protein
MRLSFFLVQGFVTGDIPYLVGGKEEGTMETLDLIEEIGLTV